MGIDLLVNRPTAHPRCPHEFRLLPYSCVFRLTSLPMQARMLEGTASETATHAYVLVCFRPRWQSQVGGHVTDRQKLAEVSVDLLYLSIFDQKLHD